MSNLKIMMKYFRLPVGRKYLMRVSALLFSLMSLGHAYAAPTIVSTVPASVSCSK